MHRSSLPLVAALLGGLSLAGTLATATSAAAWLSLPRGSGGLDAPGLVVSVKSKCKLKAECDYFAPANTCKHPPCCKKWHVEKICEPKDSGTKTPPADTKVQQSRCPLGTKPDGRCVCPAGQMNYSDGSCAKPCGYGMSGKPPNCRCVTGATLQVTGPTTKGCLCPDGKKPAEVDGNYACQNLGPQ